MVLGQATFMLRKDNIGVLWDKKKIPKESGKLLLLTKISQILLIITFQVSSILYLRNLPSLIGEYI